MSVFIGLDPGGVGSFGWALLELSGSGELWLLASGIEDHAEAAVASLMDATPSKELVRAAGIDAPLYWTPSGRRDADAVVRSAMVARGAPYPGGTVQHPNALRGACVVQGPLAALLLREHWPSLAISEAHPKAMRHFLPRDSPVARIEATQHTDHERDAALGALAAWAMDQRAEGWRDLSARETQRIVEVVPRPFGYWFPAG